MKKHVAGIALGLTCAAAMSFGAFAGEVTVDDILSHYQEASSDVTEMNCSVDMAADASIVLPDVEGEQGTMSIAGTGAMDMAMTLDPLAVEIDMDMAGDAMGQGGEMQMQMYMDEKEDGAIGMYMSAAGMGAEEGWQYAEIPAEQTKELLDMIRSGQTGDFSAYPIDFALADDMVEVNGHNCYALTAALNWEDLKGIISTALETVKGQLSEEEAAQFEQIDQYLAVGDAVLGGLVINMEIDVDEETYRPLYAHFDLNDSDWTIVGALLAQNMGLTTDDGNLMNVDVNVTDLHVDYFYDYDTPVAIEIPEEAIAAEENGIVLDEDAAASMIGEAEESLEESMTE